MVVVRGGVKRRRGGILMALKGATFLKKSSGEGGWHGDSLVGLGWQSDVGGNGVDGERRHA